MVPNVPAIQMEEILPIAVSKSATLAPQEVYAHKKAPTQVPSAVCLSADLTRSGRERAYA